MIFSITGRFFLGKYAIVTAVMMLTTNMFVGRVRATSRWWMAPCYCHSSLLLSGSGWFQNLKPTTIATRTTTSSSTVETIPITPATTDKNDNMPSSTTQLSSSSSSSLSAPQQYDEQQIDLKSGVSMKVTLHVPKSYSLTPSSSAGKKEKPVLVFLHGSLHGGWCWEEKFFPYFVEKRYPVLAPWWRGTGGTFAGKDVKKVKIQEHVADLESFLDQLPSILQQQQQQDEKNRKEEETDVVVKPILIAHSFGSLAIMKLLECHPERTEQLGGIVMMCPVPPSGNGKIIGRFLRRFQWIQSYKITVGFALKKACTNISLCRDLFFRGNSRSSGTADGSTDDNNGVSDADVARYQEYFTRDSAATINLFDLTKQLPSAKCIEDGKAPFYATLPPCMVLGATRDFIVDAEAVRETARYFNVLPENNSTNQGNQQKLCFVDAPHDVMLTDEWTHAAVELDEWLNGL